MNNFLTMSADITKSFTVQFAMAGSVVTLVIWSLSKLVPVIATALHSPAPMNGKNDYITRTEYESRHRDIMRSLERIEGKVDNIRLQ